VEKLTKENIDKLIDKKYNTKILDVQDQEQSCSNNDKSLGIGYVLIVPYSEGFKIFKNSILKALNNATSLKVVSRTQKIESMFGNKSPTPLGLCSDLIYQYTCENKLHPKLLNFL